MQHIAWDATAAAEHREEVTQAQAVAIMAEARAAWMEKMAQESAILLATARGEADEAARGSPV
jgi:hypothetical protein